MPENDEGPVVGSEEGSSQQVEDYLSMLGEDETPEPEADTPEAPEAVVETPEPEAEVLDEPYQPVYALPTTPDGWSAEDKAGVARAYESGDTAEFLEALETANRNQSRAIATQTARAEAVAHAAAQGQFLNLPQEFVQVHGGAMQEVLMSMPPETRMAKESLDYAQQYAVFKRGQQIGQAKAFAEAARLLERQPAQPARPGKEITPAETMSTPKVQAPEQVRQGKRDDYDLRKLKAIVGDSDLVEDTKKALGWR